MARYRMLIELKYTFSFFFYQEKGKPIDVVSLIYNDESVLKGWMEITEMIAVLEAATRNKLGTKQSFKVGALNLKGIMGENGFLVCIDAKWAKPLHLNIVQVSQFASILNKLLQGANKYYQADNLDL